jgi:hypothetical protein
MRALAGFFKDFPDRGHRFDLARIDLAFRQ